eukprot:1932749-Rhodomonas_salina.1
MGDRELCVCVCVCVCGGREVSSGIVEEVEGLLRGLPALPLAPLLAAHDSLLSALCQVRYPPSVLCYGLLQYCCLGVVWLVLSLWWVVYQYMANFPTALETLTRTAPLYSLVLYCLRLLGGTAALFCETRHTIS